MAEFVEAAKHVIGDQLSREWGMLIGREHGPLAFRIVIQPIVAACLAIRSGVKDSRAGRPAYGWTVVTTTDPVHRRELIRKGWRDVGRLFAAAVVIDLVYEIIVFRWIYPGQVLIVAATLALPTYFLIRGLANRLARRWLNSEQRRLDA
ncbi:hypothetical protein [Bradyrhizobium liaoningense]|uniref:hypothetical protein n=1 Tax=Bradyrhizobium liaoningense TaxID=43992 RepID=UPI001BACB197|nr:hypothetical protein [Bradyrhizobium liaoningense]MBR0717663.1 hypothetical protein [Bradyrhizobium liaoningense]